MLKHLNVLCKRETENIEKVNLQYTKSLCWVYKFWCPGYNIILAMVCWKKYELLKTISKYRGKIKYSYNKIET